MEARTIITHRAEKFEEFSEAYEELMAAGRGITLRRKSEWGSRGCTRATLCSPHLSGQCH
jgi:hypothetical protein